MSGSSYAVSYIRTYDQIQRIMRPTILRFFAFRLLNTMCVVFVSFFFVLPRAYAKVSEDTSLSGLSYARIGIINNASNFQLEVTVDGRNPYILDRGQTGSFLLDGNGIIGEHKLAAKAYLPRTKQFRRRRIGKKYTTVFHIIGSVRTSPLGKVGWYHIFTCSDFLPQSTSFHTQIYRQARANIVGITRKVKFPIRYRKKWKKGNVQSIILEASEEHQIPAALLNAVIEVESAFNIHAVSRKGAIGLMQLMPETCARFGIQRPFDPQQNVEGGTKYLSYLLHEWSLQFPPSRRLEFSLAAYNAGEKNVEHYSGLPPFRETRNYVRKVLRRYKSVPQIERSVH